MFILIGWIMHIGSNSKIILHMFMCLIILSSDNVNFKKYMYNAFARSTDVIIIVHGYYALVHTLVHTRQDP